MVHITRSTLQSTQQVWFQLKAACLFCTTNNFLVNQHLELFFIETLAVVEGVKGPKFDTDRFGTGFVRWVVIGCKIGMGQGTLYIDPPLWIEAQTLLHEINC